MGCDVMQRTERVSIMSLVLSLAVVIAAGCATPGSHGTLTERAENGKKLAREGIGGTKIQQTGVDASAAAHRTVGEKKDGQVTGMPGEGAKTVAAYSGETGVQIAVTRADGTKSISQCQYRDGRVVQQTTTHADGSKHTREYRYKDGRVVQQLTTRADGTKEAIEYRYKEGKVVQQTITRADGTRDTFSMADAKSAKNHLPLDWLFNKQAPSPLEWLLSQQSPEEEDWTFRRHSPAPLDWVYTSDELSEVSKDRSSFLDISIDLP